MRYDRLGWRILKAAILFGALGLLIEGLFELRLLAAPLTEPPSVPGESKIIEHFLVQHIAFPAIGLTLVFAPLRLRRLVTSKLAVRFLAILALLVSVPEAIVSRVDLFRPYPFDLHSPLLGAVQMADFGFVQVNLLQLQHVLFAHLAVMGTIIMLAVFGSPMLRRFVGPRTGERTV